MLGIDNGLLAQVGNGQSQWGGSQTPPEGRGRRRVQEMGEGGCWPEMGEGGCHDDFSTTIRHKWVTVISAVVGQGPREGTGSVGRSGRPGRGMSGRGMGLSRHRNESQAHADRLGSVQDGGGAPAMMLVFEFASGLLTITCLSHLHSLLKPQTLTIAHLTRLCSSVAWTR